MSYADYARQTKWEPARPWVKALTLKAGTILYYAIR